MESILGFFQLLFLIGVPVVVVLGWINARARARHEYEEIVASRLARYAGCNRQEQR